MPWYPVKQPNNKYAVWSTISDCINAIELTESQMIEKMSEWYNDTPKNELAEQLKPAIERMNQGLTAWDWSQDWDYCFNLHLSRHGENHMVRDMVLAGLCDADELAERFAKVKTERIHDAMSDAFVQMPDGGFRELVRVEKDGGIVVSDMTAEQAKEVIARLVGALMESQGVD